MVVHFQLEKLPKFKNAVVTIGTFDGLHTGHLQIINQLKQEADAIHGETVIITFNPHPRRVVHSKPDEIKLLNTMPEKIKLLAAQGIHHLVIIPFTEAFANLTATAFVDFFLVKYFQPHTIIIGYDHHFGHNREGNYKLLQSLQQKHPYRLKQIPALVLQNSNISSTKIRQAIIRGQIETANQFLGYTYFFEGIVVEGNKLGRTIGYPTANLSISDLEKLLPRIGVYAVALQFVNTNNTAITNGANPNKPTINLKGMMNIGIRPTVGGTKKSIEVHIFNFNEMIYGQTICVFVKQYLRGEIKFNGLPELKDQLAKDALAALEILKDV